MYLTFSPIYNIYLNVREIQVADNGISVFIRMCFMQNRQSITGKYAFSHICTEMDGH